jgi:hypothetical protein
VVGGTNARESLNLSAEASQDFFNRTIQAIKAGELEFVSLDEDDENGKDEAK